jgi:hypothetical protein
VQAIVKPVVAAQVRDVLGRAAGALASPSIARRPRE